MRDPNSSAGMHDPVGAEPTSAILEQRLFIMTLELSDVATELLHCIFCFCSQSDLASLSQVNSTFRPIAEDILYRHIYISIYPLNLIPDKTWRSSLFHIIASNPQKAALLRYLHVLFEGNGSYSETQANCSILRRIADALKNAPNLVDLRIMVDQHPATCEQSLSEVIKNGHFQLHTLYCDSTQDLEGIIASQKHLRLLGIYDARGDFSFATKLIKNPLNHENLPVIFELSSFGSYNGFSTLILFPELYLPGQAFTLCRDIATSLCQGLHNSSTDGRDWSLEIQVANFSYAKTAIICELVEAMAECFVGSHVLSMEVQTSTVEGIVSKPWRIPGLLTAISRFKQLQRLRFLVPRYSHDSFHQAAKDLRSLLLNELVPACPTFVADVVNCYTARITWDSGWNAEITDHA